MEYLDNWTDAAKEEAGEAIRLYDQYRPMLKGKGMPSHAARLKEADLIRLGLEEPKLK